MCLRLRSGENQGFVYALSNSRRTERKGDNSSFTSRVLNKDFLRRLRKRLAVSLLEGTECALSILERKIRKKQD
jgi:hypothetical protein